MKDHFVTCRFYAIDGDDIGPLIRARIIANDIPGVSQLSKDIDNYFKLLFSILESGGHTIIFCGGDSLLSTTSTASEDVFDDLPVGPCTISIGIGKSAEEAYLALQLAKARGKNQVVNISSIKADTIYSWDNTDGNAS